MALHLFGSDCEDVWKVVYVCVYIYIVLSKLDWSDDLLCSESGMLGRRIWDDYVGRLLELWPFKAMEREEVWVLCLAGVPYSVYSKLFLFQDSYGQSSSLVETSSNAEEVG
jgi:hypothetical protein